ncbi:MAG: SpoIIE family protein phosphatase [Candidatus Aminicenantes bacterium]|nr:SpoIIE family protein phosphatase [Candidatus Aminicenantes bacterium]
MSTLYVYPKLAPPFSVLLEKDEAILGRAVDADVRLPDAYISGHHARIRRTSRGWTVEDSGSKNGTLVNGLRLVEPALLSPGDEISIGAVRICFDRPWTAAVEITDSPNLAVRVSAAVPSRDIISRSTDAGGVHRLDPAKQGPRADRLILVINEVSRALLLHKPLQELLEYVMDLIASHLPMDRGALFLKEDVPEKLVPRAVRISNPQLQSGPMQISRGLVDMAASQKLSVLTTDAAEDPRFAGRQSIIDMGLHSAMCVPLETGKETLGVICAERVSSREPFTDEDLRLLTLMANLAAVKIENARLVEDGLVRDRMERELRLAAEIQRGLLPKDCPSCGDFEIAAESMPSLHVGGDYFDFISLPDGHLGATIADVAGKGVSASLLMASLRAALQSEARPGVDPADLARKLNDFIFRSSASNVFITFFYGELDPVAGEFRYVNAGHNPPLLLSASGIQWPLEGTGMALGMLAGSDYGEGRVSLVPGDILVLYTDGISESRDPSGEEFGIDRIVKTIRRAADKKALEIVAALFSDLREFSGGADPEDDRTVVVIKRPSGAAS